MSVETKIKALLPSTITCYIGELPSAPANVAAIMLYSGVANLEYFGGSDATTYRPVIKIVVRNQSYETAKQWIEEIKQTLHRHTDDYFMSIFMQGYPVYLGKDPQKLHTFQVVFNIQVKE